MSDAKEKMLDLLCDKFVYGLSEEEARELETLGYDPQEAESIELTIAALGLVDLDAEAAMPEHLHSRLAAKADEMFRSAEVETGVRPERQIVMSGGQSSSWFGWLGWAAAAAACVALAFTLFMPRTGGSIATVPPTPTPTVRPMDPAEQRQRLMETSAGEMILAQWGKGNMKDLEDTVSGDVVWSDQEQKGYMRFRGLPKNDASRETYQLWIFDETQDPKTPIDGGTFDVSADGEVIIPINAKLKAKRPSAFAITVEKPGGVVVSKREKIAALAAVKPDQV